MATRRSLALASRRAPILASPPRSHAYSTAQPTPAESTTQSLSPRWLSDAKARIGHCITFGLQREQKAEAGRILQELSRDWRELVAGSEGFLTSRERRSMYRLPVVWGEQDLMGHVNNVVYNRYAETGRIGWASKYAKYIDPQHADAWRNLWTPKGDGMILRKITTEFKFPMQYPDHVTIYHKLGKEPTEATDTFDLHVVIISELKQRIAARVVEDCVLYDYRKGKKTPFRPFMLDVLRETWRLQEDAKRVNSERVIGILDRVRKLETESWDRADAVEDMGSAATT
ncbi:Hypothetical predicted protein [Lecanosticta acicola]|uniref:Thioesterase/thiol ester dehydrase-isomerase n=1 Tax=Lecanosticta acicola TaxID=111012 RepID=A0AAI9EFV7_9PEZI|nr:Hypothetical predicted protein [Lecanosticta acicola]